MDYVDQFDIMLLKSMIWIVIEVIIMAKNVITNERFYAHPGEISKEEHPENIKNKASTYYKYFDEDGNPIKKNDKDKDEGLDVSKSSGTQQ